MEGGTTTPLSRAVRDLRGAPPRRGRLRYDGGAGLERAAAAAALPLERLAATLREVESGRRTAAVVPRGGAEGGDDGAGVGTGSGAGVGAGASGGPPAAGSDLRRAADLFVQSGPWMGWRDRDSLIDAARPSLGMPSAFDPIGGNGAAHVADALYRETRGDVLGMEDAELRLNYPPNCDLTVEGDSTGEPALEALRSLPDEDLATWSVAVAGLRGHGKSALCGRLVRGLGGSSESALFRTRSGAGRYGGRGGGGGGGPPDDGRVRDAVWTMDRDVRSRSSGSSTDVTVFPLLLRRSDGPRSFLLWDLPPFLDDGPDPSLGSRRRKALGALQCARVTTLIAAVAADVPLQGAALASLLTQAVAACGRYLRRVVVAVTKMDRVQWNEQSYRAALGRVKDACGGILDGNGAYDVVYIPTSAIKQDGICVRSTPQTKGWGIDLPVSSIVSAMRFGGTHSPPSGPPLCVIFREKEWSRTFVVVTCLILKGALKVGDRLEINTDTRMQGQASTFTVREMQWFHLKRQIAYPGMFVGLRLEFDPSFQLSLRRIYDGSLRSGQILWGDGTRQIWTEKRASLRLRQLHEDLMSRKKVQLRALCHMKMLNLQVDKVVSLPNPTSLEQGSLVNAEVTVVIKQRVGFVLGESVLLFRGDRLDAFGYVAAVGDDRVSSDAQSGDYLSSMILPPVQPGPVFEVTQLLKPLPPGRFPSDRGVSTGSHWSTATAIGHSAGNFFGASTVNVDVGPAKSLHEALQQTDAIIESAMRLRHQLRQAVAAVASAPYGEEEALKYCYVCQSHCPQVSVPKNEITICAACRDLNEQKRTAPLGLDRVPSDSAFIVTGARIKIGYAVVLRLLAEGARLLVLTTRFPHLLAEKLAKERPAGFDEATIHIYGVDFRCVPAVAALGSHLAKYYPKVYALFNNAAQTVRRPSPFYASLVEHELELAQKIATVEITGLVKEVGRDPFLDSETDTAAISTASAMALTTMDKCLSYPRVASSLMTQCTVMDEDRLALSEIDLELFPRKDHDSELVDSHTGELVSDMRSQTSWKKSLLPSETGPDTVQPMECLEVLLVNTLAPFILVKALCGPLQATRGNIINVTSREGEVARVKQAEHPHTNMSKAGLNMLTRTASYELQKVGVAICSVDPGWVSNMQPLGTDKPVARKVPPLTPEDGAARVLDPIRQRLDGKRVRSGVVWRDYKVVNLKSE